MLDSLATAILNLHGIAALAVVFALPALEASAFVGIIFPAEIAIIVGGVLASQGRVPLAGAIAAAVLGAVIGDSVGYLVGARFGDRLLARLPARIVRPDHVVKAKDALNRLGGKAVLVGRLTAALRVLVPGLAGMARMPYRTFVVYNVVGGVLWATTSTLLGYAAGDSWRTLAGYLSTGGLVAFGVVVVAAAVAALIYRRRRRAASVGVQIVDAIDEPAGSVVEPVEPVPAGSAEPVA